MKDCKNNELKIGDNVVFVRGKNTFATLDTGQVTKIYKNRCGEEECSVGKQTHIYSDRVMKL